MRTDMHIHTVVSDGFLTPPDIFRAAVRLGLQRISITDHDTAGAYTAFGEDLVAAAAGHGLELVPGIELDAMMGEKEVHILGYGFDTADLALTAQLEEIRRTREARTRDQVATIRRLLGEKALQDQDIFTPVRRTYMKPHLLRPLVSARRFKNYREASDWFRANVRSEIKVPKFPAEEVVRWVVAAGGKAVLAHPGYYIVDGGFSLEEALDQLAAAGLSGVETEYRYRLTSPVFPDREAEQAMVERIRAAALARGLEQTRGSDAHTLKDMDDFDVFP